MLNQQQMTQRFTTWGMVFLTFVFGWFAPAAMASGLLKPINSQHQDLNIETHKVDVVIEDGYATTSIEQTFHNPNDQILEARYSFPVPQEAVVGEFIYWINGTPVIAESVAKDKAKKIYEEQKAQGNATALTEKDGYKTFEMRVFPVQPQQSVKVKLVYLQDALIDHGIGRYVYPMEEGGVDEARDSFWTRNDAVEQDFSFNVTLKSAYPVDGVRLPSHPNAALTQEALGEHTIWKAQVANQASGAVEEEGVTASPSAPAYRLDQDIVVYWRLQDGLPGRLDMVAYRNPEESKRGTVKLTFTPGDDLGPVTQGRDWVFVLDKSGSMSGKYNTLAEGVRQGLNKLPQQDRFRVVMFDNTTYDLTNGFLSANKENVEKALSEISAMQPSNGTNLYEGLGAAVRKLDADRPTGIVLVTDGVANVGVTEKRKFFQMMEKYDVRLFTFIMGNSANTPLLVPMTKLSNGVATSVSNADDIMGHLLNISSKLTHQAYRDIQLDIDGVKVKDLTPEAISSLYRGEQLTVFGHYFKAGTADVTLSMKVNGETRRYTTKVSLPEKTLRNPELERMWAFSAIRDLEAQMDYLEQKDADKEQAIEDIAVEYGLLTDYTSLLVVEEDVFQQIGVDRNNQARVQKEQQARQTRQAQNVQPTQADTSQPMFTQPAPTHSRSGGGSSGGSMSWMVFMLLGLGMFGRWGLANKR
ncbi:VIT and VWA domain-containing protein [Enterovibrio sp. ZSDZ42]|uniref:VIT and VWA domain-containing protein n=1 Tax=Enterovibrio gelatinilyticus TaxID=2899819 RepID=A0ABT5R3L9_9GAMM|nr:VIT and VWA domain-containing protein [Enterovibrio sp. ZSDZ42]MDD1794872.1 VIT and VWA domain-containing protein [Enterovibrio sp. ZSDZ42]